MRRRSVCHLGAATTLAALVGTPGWARAQTQPPELLNLRQLAQAQMRFFGLLIYDIRLWAQSQVDAQNWHQQVLALELEYARSLSGREIAKRSLAEMRRQTDIGAEQAQRWLSEMEAAFPDVKAGDRISGLNEPGEAIVFFVNGRLQKRITDPLFGRLFLGIWLAPQSSEPGLRSQLLGGAGGGR
ncbi:chalcone isomerase family protein [Roseateles oligotrophus]|uniref:Chalcone isomerase family protein n=1 Tax=Roseateles oligotrophus TaxID=1769250 RepID=A0ABT2YJU9_9BURK|nr:chalcone isomerase family protein [Roseateles oligotrophus]MCV2370334.1 chalcone isomerase family protein [Roseateles oligotrophus]